MFKEKWKGQNVSEWNKSINYSVKKKKIKVETIWLKKNKIKSNLRLFINIITCIYYLNKKLYLDEAFINTFRVV